MGRFPFLDFLHFSGRLAWRAFVLAVNALKIGNDFWGVVVSGLLIADTSVSLFAWYEQHVRWWVPAGVFLLLFLYGLFRASYEIEAEKETLENRIPTDEKRMALKDLLGEAREEGPRAHARAHETGDWDILNRWTDRTRDLIGAAFGKDQAQLFLSDEGYTPHSLPGQASNDVWGALARGNVGARNRYEREIGYRLQRLDSLILRADSLPIRPGFDPEEWSNH